jgi:hypothetical protein
LNSTRAHDERVSVPAIDAAHFLALLLNRFRVASRGTGRVS